VVDPVGSVVAPGPATVEATSSAGAVYTYNLPTAIGAFKHATVTATVACTPASGSTFAIATTLVSCTATDEFQTTATATFTVTVRDTTAPVVTPPADITIGATGTTGAAVTFPAGSATDIVDGAVPVTCTGYASGDTFPIGTTTVTCSATDSAGNTGTGSFKVTVTPPPPSGPADADACKHDGWKDYPDLHFKNQGDCVSYVATHGKNPPAGDNHDNSSNSDHKPPKLDVPDNITVHTTDEHGTKVTYTVSATDDSGRRPEVHCTAPSGSLFEVGKTTVKCSAADASGNTVVGTFNVTVVLDHPKKDDAKDGDGEHGDHQDDHH
jgi:hypothetical protein